MPRRTRFSGSSDFPSGADTSGDLGTGESEVAKKALIEKSKRKPKFGVRAYHRCNRCGRPRGYVRKFGICRICFRRWRCGARSLASARRAGRGARER